MAVRLSSITELPESAEIQSDDIFLVSQKAAGSDKYLSRKATISKFPIADTIKAGLMSNTAFSKLDGIEVGANKYVLPIASDDCLGGIKVGAGLEVTEDGTVNLTAAYELPTASPTSLGGIKVGDNLAIDGNGVLSARPQYVLPAATTTDLGGVTVGNGLLVTNNGTLKLNQAAANALGGIKVGDNLAIDGNGVLSARPQYVLPAATTTSLGGITVGDKLTIDDDGKLDSTASTVSVDSYYSQDLGTKIATISIDNVATDLFAPKQQISSVYRWQSTTDVLGQYSWFEIWPDGWCRQGGNIHISNFATKSGSAYGATGRQATQLFDIIFSNASYNTHGDTILCSDTTGGFDVESNVTFMHKSTISCQISEFAASNQNKQQSINWTAEGFRNEQLCTLADISAKYADIGNWSSSLIGMNGTYSNSFGGGVIDGTALKTSRIDVLPTDKEKTYEVENDCWIFFSPDRAYGNSTNGQKSISICINGKTICYLESAYYNASGTGYCRKESNGFPVKKGTAITLIGEDDTTLFSAASYIDVTEYKLNSLAPQIAMPDYSATPIPVTSNNWKATANGWIQAYIQPTTTNKYGYVAINNVKICEARNNTNSWVYQQYSIAPISKDDIVTYGDAKTYTIKFYPCKSVPQQDCASYVIESGKFCSTDGTTHTTDSENDSWYRLYSDGWCEQGGMTAGTAANETVKLKHSYVNVSYSVQVTESCTTKADYAPTANHDSTSQFTIYANQAIKRMWEAKGFIR